jgi:hypothetical protein
MPVAGSQKVERVLVVLDVEKVAMEKALALRALVALFASWDGGGQAKVSAARVALEMGESTGRMEQVFS